MVKVAQTQLVVAANRFGDLEPYLQGKRIGVVANQTSIVFKKNGNYVHLIDSLLLHKVNVVKVFTPEHGFRGAADAGESVENDIDMKTGISLISLYGKNRKPSQESLDSLDLMVFDIQDVGVRFYTYISTLAYVMEACAEKGIELIVLDRPNPNGHYIDGPTLEMANFSFVGMHPIPLVYGMTIGEYAQMINGEGWLPNNLHCKLRVLKLINYSRNSEYSLPVRPSPNLPNDVAINLYPSLGFFEGTIINAGRGTEYQFQRYGAPFFPVADFSYTPQPNFGSKNPKFNGSLCYGVDLSKTKRLEQVNLEWLIDAYNKTPVENKFFGSSFTIHAGTQLIQQQIESGLSAAQIRETWKAGIENFKKIRKKYLLYPDL
ncbi:MAG: DUF1343 domain-containing protein [Flavobacteriaceae bacterium]|nr:DUF1343 domain-containing protein [Flavobacteriaceae bacterium]